MSAREQKQHLDKALYEIDHALIRNQAAFSNLEGITTDTPVKIVDHYAQENEQSTKITTTRSDDSPGSKRFTTGWGYVRKFMLYTAITWLGVHLLLGILQRQLIYLGSKLPAGDPVNYGFAEDQVREIVIPRDDGVRLVGWHVLPVSMTKDKYARQISELSDSGKKYLDESVILYFPGNAGHRGYRHATLKDLASLKAHVVIVDYRGYSDSTGSPTEFALVDDALRLYSYLRDELKFNPERIILFGESLGGGVSTQLASVLGSEQLQLGGLIIQSSFDSLENVAQLHYRYLAVRWLLLDKFQSIIHIPKITCALFSIHGEQDEVIPLEMGKKLFSAAPTSSAKGILKEFYQIPLCGHNDVRESGGLELKLKIGEFIRKVESVAKK